MTAEELEGLAVENDAERVAFEVAFARAALVQAAKPRRRVRAPDALSARRRGVPPGEGGGQGRAAWSVLASS